MYDVKKVRTGRGRPINPKDEYEVIGPRKPNEASKSPWEYKVRKKAKEAQGKGPRMPKGKQMGHRSP